MTEYINNIPVDKLTITEIINELPKLLSQTKKWLFMSVNPQIALHAHKYPSIIELLEKASHRIPDGVGIVKASKKLGGNITERVAGIDLMIAFLQYANTHSLSIYLYGSRPDVLKNTILAIKRDYPNIKVLGATDGYTDKSTDEIVSEINRLKPTFLFVALGFPLQELWIAETYERLDVQVIQDVGGSFDVISGSVKRAPEWVIRLNIEWLYRSLSHPSRLKRIVELPIFLREAKKASKKSEKKGVN